MARLEHVHRGDPAQPAIVFVHGLGGDMFDTWVAPGAARDDCWLHWVGVDTGCDTWTLGYDAALIRWQDQAMPLSDQATQIAQLLAVHPGLRERSLVLVGHSMGGLVIKALLTQTHAAGDARTRALVGRVRGLVFVATPHQGSQLATLANAVSLLLRTNAQVGDMKRHDAQLRQLGASFRELRRTFGWKVAVFTEGRDVVWKGKGLLGLFGRQIGARVVDPSSGDPALEGVTAVPLAEDHFSICKPSSRDAQIHHAFVAFMRDDILISPATPSDKFPTVRQSFDEASTDTLDLAVSAAASVRDCREWSRTMSSTQKNLLPLNRYPIGPMIRDIDVRCLAENIAELLQSTNLQSTFSSINGELKRAAQDGDPMLRLALVGFNTDQPARRLWEDVLHHSAIQGPRMLAAVLSHLDVRRLEEPALCELAKLVDKLNEHVDTKGH